MNRCDSGTDSIVWMIEDFNARIFVQLIIKAPEVYSGAFFIRGGYYEEKN